MIILNIKKFKSKGLKPKGNIKVFKVFYLTIIRKYYINYTN